MYRPRTRPIIIRFRLSENQERKLVECHEAHNIKCSLNLYAQQLFNTALNAMFYDCLVRSGKIKRGEPINERF